MAEHDRPRPNRARPFVGCTVHADVDAAVRAEARRQGEPFSHAVERLLRAGLATVSRSQPPAMVAAGVTEP